jgi:hypothetical protein
MMWMLSTKETKIQKGKTLVEDYNSWKWVDVKRGLIRKLP